MDNLYLYVGIIGNIISVLMFLSPVKTFWRIVKKGSTEEFMSLPYICTLLNSCLWTYYGITKPGSYLVATVNGFGILVEIVYISLFLIYAPPRIRAKTAKVAGIVDVVVFAGAVLVTQFGMEGDMRIDVIGFMGAALNIIMYASPLSAMLGMGMGMGRGPQSPSRLQYLIFIPVSVFVGEYDHISITIPNGERRSAIMLVVTSKSVEYMPFLLSLFLFLNGGVWTFYAFLVRDWFLAVPNGTGFALGAAQLALYSIYRESKPLKVISDDFDDGGQRRHLLSSSTSNNTKPV